MPDGDFLAQNSRHIENVFRHAFLFALSRHLLLQEPPQKLIVLNAEVDDSGVDLVLTLGSMTRFVQMKSRNGGHAKVPYAIAESLFSLPGGCVVWMHYDAATLEPTVYHYLGAGVDRVIGNAMDYPQATRTKNGAKVVRAGYRNVRSQQATHKNLDIGELTRRLFGDRPAGAGALQGLPVD